MNQENIEIQFAPRKKVKRDNQKQNNNQQQADHKSNQSIFCKCYSQKQISSIISAIVGIQNYTKYISVQIRHQQKSLSILPKHMLQMEPFRELNNRVNQCIKRARINNQFLNLIIKNYSEELSEVLKAQKVENKDNQITPNGVLNIFVYIIREWSNMSTHAIKPMNTTIQLIKKHSNNYVNHNQGLRPKIFVQSAGMGRILCEISEQLSPQPLSIESCQQKPFHYLCSQYFISQYLKNQSPKQIYPFIHDFSNKFKTNDFYQCIKVPQFTHKKQNSEIQINFPQINLNLATFEQDYIANSFNNQWDILLSFMCNDRINNILKWIQIVYKGLKEQGLWVIACYSSFEKNVIPITYQQFRDVLSKTQFKIIDQFSRWEKIISDIGMTEQMIIVHYLALQK